MRLKLVRMGRLGSSVRDLEAACPHPTPEGIQAPEDARTEQPGQGSEYCGKDFLPGRSVPHSDSEQCEDLREVL